MTSQSYPSASQFNKAISSDIIIRCLDLNLSLSYGIVSSKMYDESEHFDFVIALP